LADFGHGVSGLESNCFFGLVTLRTAAGSIDRDRPRPEETIMRIALTSFIVLMGLMISAAAMAGHHEADAEEGAEQEMPPIEAAPPADTPITSPAAPRAGEGDADTAASEGKEEN
jgi:hypothetical protein